MSRVGSLCVCFVVLLGTTNAEIAISLNGVSKAWHGVGMLDSAYMSTGDIAAIRSYQNSYFLHRNPTNEAIEVQRNYGDNPPLWEIHYESTTNHWFFESTTTGYLFGVDDADRVKEINHLNDQTRWKRFAFATVYGDEASPRRGYSVIQNVATGQCLRVSANGIIDTNPCTEPDVGHLFYFEIVSSTN